MKMKDSCKRRREVYIGREEFENSLNCAVEFWGKKSAEDVCGLLGKDVSKMVGFEQRNLHHCHDLWMHSLYAVEMFPKEVPILLKTAAFFHDIGKTYTAREKHGRLTFYGHAKKSAAIAGELLEKLCYSAEEIEEICFYIAHHDDFISWVLPEEEYDKHNRYLIEITSANIKKHIARCMKEEAFQKFVPKMEHWINLVWLCYADVQAQSEKVFMGGKLIMTKTHKLKKLDRIQQYMLELNDIA